MQIKTGLMAFALVLFPALAHAERNMDFSQSPCAPIALKTMKNGVAVGIESDSSITSFKVVDGDNDPWRRNVNLPEDLSNKLIWLSSTDGWAVYQTIKKKNKLLAFYELLMFGNLRTGECIVYPDDGPWYVAVSDMPVVAVRLYLGRLAGESGDGTPDAVRSRLQAFMDGSDAQTVPTPRPVSQVDLLRLPKIVQQQMIDWQDVCVSEYDAQASFTADYVTVTDVEGDGDADYILSGTGASCMQNGKTVASGSGNHAARVTIYLTTTKGVAKAFDDLITGAEIRSFKGYSIFDTGVDVGGMNVKTILYRIKNGAMKKIRKAPKGGTVVYSFTIG